MSIDKPQQEEDKSKFNYGTVRLQVINSRISAYRQANPTWGQNLLFAYSHEISGSHISQFYSASDLAFPAFHPTHYLLVNGEVIIQDISDGSIQLSSNYDGARGFPYYEGQTQYHVGLTYGFPLWYPDIGIGNIFYTRHKAAAIL